MEPGSHLSAPVHKYFRGHMSRTPSGSLFSSAGVWLITHTKTDSEAGWKSHCFQIKGGHVNGYGERFTTASVFGACVIDTANNCTANSGMQSTPTVCGSPVAAYRLSSLTLTRIFPAVVTLLRWPDSWNHFSRFSGSLLIFSEESAQVLELLSALLSCLQYVLAPSPRGVPFPESSLWKWPPINTGQHFLSLPPSSVHKSSFFKNQNWIILKIPSTLKYGHLTLLSHFCVSIALNLSAMSWWDGSVGEVSRPASLLTWVWFPRTLIQVRGGNQLHRIVLYFCPMVRACPYTSCLSPVLNEIGNWAFSTFCFVAFP